MLSWVKIRLLVLTISVILVSCGGGGASGNLPTASEPSGKITGTVFIGKLSKGDINVYEFSNEVRGIALASTVINPEDGTYSVALRAASKPIVVCLSNATYFEITTPNYTNPDPTANIKFSDGQELCAVKNYISGETTNVVITFYSHIAGGLASRLVVTAYKAADAVIQANAEIKHWVGYDVTSIVPYTFSKPTNNAEIISENISAFMNAAVSLYVSKNNNGNPKINNSILFAQRAYQDISFDGLLNGTSELGQLTFDTIQLSQSVYRYDIAFDIANMISHKNNISGIQQIGALNQIAQLYSQFDVPGTNPTTESISVHHIFNSSATGCCIAF